MYLPCIQDFFFTSIVPEPRVCSKKNNKFRLEKSCLNGEDNHAVFKEREESIQ